MASNISVARQRSRIKRKIKALQKAPEAAYVRGQLMGSGRELAAMQRRHVPRDSGDAYDSIQVKPVNGKIAVRVTAGGRKTFYVRFIEFGTRNASAHPFIFSSWRLMRKRIAKRIRNSIKVAARRAWRK
jgi:HK97 gp10 family phage protein